MTSKRTLRRPVRTVRRPVAGPRAGTPPRGFEPPRPVRSDSTRAPAAPRVLAAAARLAGPIRWLLPCAFAAALLHAGEKTPAAPPQVLTNAVQVRHLTGEQTRRGLPVHLDGVVTYADPDWNMLFVQDATAGVFVLQSGGGPPLATGQRVRVEGFGDPGSYLPVVGRARVRPEGAGELPRTATRSIASLVDGSEDGNWVQIDGTVGSVAPENSHLVALNVHEGRDWVKVLVREASETEVRHLVNARVSIRGVCTAGANDRREVVGIKIFVPGLAFVTLDTPAPADRFHAPVRPLADLTDPDAAPAGATPVHVHGVIQAALPDQGLILRDRSGSMRLAPGEAGTLTAGSWIDAIGIPGRTETGLVFNVDAVRRVGFTGTNEVTFDGPPGPRNRPLTTVQEIRNLSPEEAGSGRPVQVRAVVTYYDPGWGMMFVQDSTAGIYVDVHGAPLDVEVGHWIELEGVTSPGDFAPTITLPHFRILGEAPLPAAQHFNLKEVDSGTQDSQWLQMSGVVRSADVQDGHLNLDVADAGGHFEVIIPYPGNLRPPSYLVDARLRLLGACGTIFNQRRQLVGVRLFLPGLDFVGATPGRTIDPFTRPARPINSLLRFTTLDEAEHRIRVQGVVTLHRPKEFLYIQDETGGLRVLPAAEDDATGVAVGDRLDVVGFVEAGNYTPVLARASFRKIRADAPVAPVQVTAEAALSADFEKDIYDGKLVRLQGRLLDLTARARGESLVLQDGTTVFNASLVRDTATQARPNLREGSLLELTGVCSVQVDSGRAPKSFEIHLRSPADIAVLQTPPWWNLSHAMTVLAAMSGLVLLTVIWIAALRRRVEAQTRLIHHRLEREQALESRYRELFECNPHPMWVFDLETLAFLAVNDAAVVHYGYSRGEFLRMTAREIRPESDVEDLLKRLEATRGHKSNRATGLRHRRKNGEIIEVEVASHPLIFGGRPARLVLVSDVTERKRAEADLERLNRELVAASRRAGMAEVATGVLHNIGNVLNSVNVSAALVAGRVHKSRAGAVRRVATMLQERAADLAAFLTADARGRELPGYFTRLAECLESEREGILLEIDSLRKNIDHIKDIVAVQQSYAKVSGVVESVEVTDLIEDSLRMNSASLSRHGVRIVREYANHLPRLSLDKHKVLQILINLVRNAKYACDASGRPDKCLTVRVTNGDDRVRIAVADNGVGIPQEHLTRIFSHGFTTRKDGHGFGLHSGALAAREMGGCLTAASPGSGLGATFTLELPVPESTPDHHE